METECFDTGKDNLLNVAKGVYNAMQIARDQKSGNYYNAINFNWFKKYRERKNMSHAECGADEWLSQAVRTYQDELSKNYSLDATAMGIMSEVVGTALGFQSPTDAVGKVIATLGNLTEQFSSARDSRGFFSHFYVHQQGAGSSSMNTTSPLATGLLVQAALFARSYFYAIGAGERLRVGGAEMPIEASERASFGLQVTSLEALAAQLYDSVDFKSILCDSTTGLISPEGEGIPFTIGTAASSHPNMCGKATAYPDAEGLYEFSEAHNSVYLAYQQACGAQKPGECNYTNIELMWNRWQKRRNSPNHHYTDYPILSTSGAYMLQMLWYTTNSFNNDTRYEELFHNHWLADESFYKQALYAGKRGRYGLGEGPESKWCNEQKSYNSLHLHEKNQKFTHGVREGLILGSHGHCAALSANIVAGNAPINPTLIQQQLLLLLEDGETVEPIPCTNHAVLWRESLLDSKIGVSTSMGRDSRITIVDLAPSLLGLASLFLPDKNFFKKYSRHFAHSGEADGPTSLAEIKARRQRLVIEKAELAEAEMLLVKCHALCDPNGLGIYKLSHGNTSSASPEQCTLDCAASLVHGELFSSGGRQNRTQSANASRLLRQTKDDASEHGKLSQAQVLLKCHAECGASSHDTSACTMDCALRRLHDGRAGRANVTVAPLHASNLNAEHRRAKLESTRDLLEITRALSNYTTRARSMQEAALAPSNHTKRAAPQELTQEQILLK